MHETCNLCPGPGEVRMGPVYLCRECAEDVRAECCGAAQETREGETPEQRAEGRQ